jgi:hypothetical protein
VKAAASAESTRACGGPALARAAAGGVRRWWSGGEGGDGRDSDAIAAADQLVATGHVIVAGDLATLGDRTARISKIVLDARIAERQTQIDEGIARAVMACD